MSASTCRVAFLKGERRILVILESETRGQMIKLLCAIANSRDTTLSHRDVEILARSMTLQDRQKQHEQAALMFK